MYWLSLVDCVIIDSSWINLLNKQIDTSSLISVGLDQIHEVSNHEGIFLPLNSGADIQKLKMAEKSRRK